MHWRHGCFLPCALSRSRCLIPSRGRALLAFAPTIFSIPLPPAVALSLPSRACCKNSVVTADPLTLSLLCGCDGFNVAPGVSRCKQFLRYLVLPNTYCPTYIFRLQTNAACITITQMNTPEKTIVGGIRLTPSYWAKFRQVWKARGRDWMLRWIDKEHSKLPKDGAS